MILGIDCSNIRAGGGITHISNILRYAEPARYGFEKVVVWGGAQLQQLPDLPWIDKQLVPEMNGPAFKVQLWKMNHFNKALRRHGVDVLLAPGGTYAGRFRPYVSMSQNMLVFEKQERDRFPFSLNKLRYLALNVLQTRSFSHAQGIIFISRYARDYILHSVPQLKEKQHTVIYHGVSARFQQAPRAQRPVAAFSAQQPFKILYVSIINYYKHQLVLMDAVEQLHRKGYHISLELVGPLNPALEKAFREKLQQLGHCVKYAGKIGYEQINATYQQADLFVFASTCENMPNILVEAMSAGLPILSSSYGPMPEILQEAGDYFDPTNVADTTRQLEALLLDQQRREHIAQAAFEKAKQFSWESASNETLSFLHGIARHN
ncbi:glycosyltransferase family 4 protein [Chitinophaga agrisoli]|uniref:Glycosyltransferase family 4 protein n=1 Tax=Chitinophaga agrisoli TaxID=2607653 RepID=A0A5B2VLV2_9BACT|nr:glycosyltransferase family 1 protein [Chitinophaga agrisoli]KAA2239189.1 glycosyltransferase family 4 protein [Chitinophaga agrisoli]